MAKNMLLNLYVNFKAKTIIMRIGWLAALQFAEAQKSELANGTSAPFVSILYSPSLQIK